MKWRWWGVEIRYVPEDAILVTALSAVSPNVTMIGIYCEHFQAIDILDGQEMTDTVQRYIVTDTPTGHML